MRTSFLFVLFVASVAWVQGAEVTERGRHHKVVQTVQESVNGSGQAVLVTNRHTAIGNGMHYRDANSNWVESVPIVQSFSGGIVCTGTSYRVILATNLNTDGSVDFETSDHQRILSHPLGIRFFDPQSGNSVILAQVTNSHAEIISNQVVYPHAFEGDHLDASVSYQYRAGVFHQDVTILYRPTVTPTNFGMGPRTRLEVLTEIVESPTPTNTVHIVKQELDPVTRTDMVEPDLVDEALNFGEMTMTVGRAYQSENSQSRHGTLVAKWLVNIGEGRTFLVEAVEWQDIEQALTELPEQMASIAPPGSAPIAKAKLPDRRVNSERRRPFPTRLAEITRSRPILRASAGSNSQVASVRLPRGLVIDYTTVQNANDYVFSNWTYRVQGDVLLGKADVGTTFQAGAVIKFDVGASLTVMDGLVGPEGDVVFTAIDDDSIGSNIDGQPSTPSGRYAEFALGIYYVPGMYLEHLDIRHAQTGILFGSGGYTILSSYFYECDLGIDASDISISVTADMCEVDTLYEEGSSGEVSGVITECQADRDSDGLPDNWEFEHFGTLSREPGVDSDVDGVTNLQEYQSGTNPTDQDSDNDGMVDQRFRVSISRPAVNSVIP